ncbi:MAG TPA: hypothetical protein H9754_08705 [Candidatus Anaerostipes avistercoris]|uniref:Uncharacterized protein n=1 Tax=Candidatus Anaerostipes avistercoris TaxID=2838462 RepID=A0A9D2PJB5_9FIRM|nr:hypothetical protein [Candidatus Anaerostipes avistercoris]
MGNLLIFRERILKFLASKDKALRLVGRFLGGTLLFFVTGEMYGYGSLVAQPFMSVIFGLICAFVPVSVVFLLYHLVVFLQLSAMAVEVGILYLILIGLYFLIYQRMFKKTEIIFLITPIFFYFHIPAVLPLFVGSFVGLYGLPAILMGSCCYYFAATVQEAVIQMNNGTENGQIYNLVVDSTTGNTELMLCIVIFILVVAVVTGIRKMWIAYGWYIAILAGGVIYTFAMLIGGYFANNEVNILAEILSIVVSFLIVMIGQFLYSVIDYTREENLEYEDEEYYYYVRAIPKITMEEEMSVKKVFVPARRFYLKHKEKQDNGGEKS